MKKFTFLFSLLLIAALHPLNAQPCSQCTPAFTTCPPAGGLCNKLDTAYANHFYDKQINFYMPKVLTDPSVIAQCQCNWVELRAIRVTGVSGLPTGVTYTLSQNGSYNVIGGDSIGCSHFCGTPLVPGMYPVTVYLEADVTAHGTPIGDVNQNNNPQQYKDTLYVLPDTVAGVSSFTYGNNGFAACDSITVTLNAQLTAPQPNPTRYFWNIAGQEVEAKTPGVFTFTNVSVTQPDTFPITLTTVYYNFLVKKVHIINVNGGYCGDIEELTCICVSGADSPDPYVKFSSLGFNNDVSAGSNTCHNVDFNNLNLLIPIGTASIDMEVWDLDTRTPIIGTPDDFLGTYSLGIFLGQRNFMNGNAEGWVEFDTIAGTTITETLNVIVNPYPTTPSVVAASDTFCSADSVRISVNNAYSDCTYEWYRDTVFLTAAIDSFFYSNAAGNYKVKVTNPSGCQAESGWKAITKVTSPAASISIIYTGPSLFVTPFSTEFAVDWYYNGNLVVGQNGKFLSFLGNGEYRAELYNKSYPSCRTSSSSDTIVSGISELTDNSIYDLQVYPNPNQGKFNLKFTSDETQAIRLFVQNLMGQNVLERRIENFAGEFSEQIDISAWSKGVYFIAVETEHGKLNRKVVVQ